jgi:uridine phosphorylase
VQHAPIAPIIDHDTTEPPVFEPANLLDGARRQKRLPASRCPAACLLDMDGELVERLVASGRATADPTWACFHTRLFQWNAGGVEFGVIAGTVGAPFAVLVAEELFASGCEALVSISSAGLVTADVHPPFFALIERALRDEGTSYHYVPPARFAEADAALANAVARALDGIPTPLLRGASWTTDAPFRESAALIESRRSEGIISVEMEAAALLAMGQALRKPVTCIAHVTNVMATRPDDFEKGGHDGQEEALDVCRRALIAALAHAGAENVLLAVGLGAACETAAKWIGMPAIRELRDRFEKSLKARLGGRVTVNGAGAERLPNTANVNFVGQVGAEVLARAPGLAASTGSACHADSVELSPVLAAMGVPKREGMGAVRFSLGHTTTWEQLERVLAHVAPPGEAVPCR